jgi:hypothetical protein
MNHDQLSSFSLSAKAKAKGHHECTSVLAGKEGSIYKYHHTTMLESHFTLWKAPKNT